MDQLKETGGARIGSANATWPFATLTATKDKLELNSGMIGKLIFKPADIISLEPYFGFMSGGIKINHCVSAYKEKVIFWTFKNPKELIKQIEETGFLSNNAPVSADLRTTIDIHQTQGGSPIRKPVAIGMIVIWNLFFLYDFVTFFIYRKSGFLLGIGAQSALAFVLIVCILLLISAHVRGFVLKEGRCIDDIKRFIYFVIPVCIFMLMQLTFVHSLNRH